MKLKKFFLFGMILSFGINIYSNEFRVYNVGDGFKLNSKIRSVKEVISEPTCWKGETILFHFAVESDYTGVVKVSFDKAKFSNVSISFFEALYVAGDGKIKYADLLNSMEEFTVSKGFINSIWVKVDVPKNSAIGDRTIPIIFRNGDNFVEKSITFKVADRILPAPRERKFVIDLWQNPNAIARWHNVKIFSDEFFKIAKPYLKMYGDIGGDNLTTAIIKDPWNSQTYDVYSSMIEWKKVSTDKFIYDFSNFDKWVQLAIDCGVTGQISCYTMIPWNNKFFYYNEELKKEELLVAKPDSKEFKQHWTPFLRDFVRHLKTKGWLEKVAIAMDEREESLMLSLIEYLKDVAPELKITSATNYFTNLTENIYEISPVIKVTDKIEKNWLQKRKEKNKITTFYICVDPKLPNTFTKSNPDEAKWLGLYAKAKNLDGFLRWAFNCWPENPNVETAFGKWPAGDTFLIYPGPKYSVRLEKLLQGFSLFEKISILERELNSEQKIELNKILSDVNFQGINISKLDRDLKKVDEFLRKNE